MTLDCVHSEGGQMSIGHAPHAWHRLSQQLSAAHCGIADV